MIKNKTIILFLILLNVCACKRDFSCDCTTTSVTTTTAAGITSTSTAVTEMSPMVRASTLAEGREMCFSSYAHQPDTSNFNPQGQVVRTTTCSIQ